MSSDLVFKLVISEQGKDVYSEVLSYEAISNIVSDSPDNSESNSFYALAARHPASTVREKVAYKDNLSNETIDLLSKDTSISVLRNLVGSSAFRKYASQEYLESLIALDVDIAQSIASNVESFEQADINQLANLISTHIDPSVVASLAGNYGTPKKILKSLLKHTDPYVKTQAKARFE